MKKSTLKYILYVTVILMALYLGYHFGKGVLLPFVHNN